MRKIIKQSFTNIESKWEKIKRAIQEASKEMLGYAKRATPVEWLTAEMINLVGRKKETKKQMKRQSAGIKTLQLSVQGG